MEFYFKLEEIEINNTIKEFYLKLEENEINDFFEFIDNLKERALNEKNEDTLTALHKCEENFKKIYITK